MVGFQIIFLVPIFTTMGVSGATVDPTIQTSLSRHSFRHLNLLSRSTGCRVSFISDSEMAGQDVCGNFHGAEEEEGEEEAAGEESIIIG